MSPPRTNILGVGVSALNLPLAADTIEAWIGAGERQYVCITGVHGIMESQRDPALLQIHNRAGLVAPDGMPLVYLSRLRGRAGVDRVYGPDLMLELCRRSPEKGYSHFLYGATPQTLIRLHHALERRFPGIRIAGSYSPPFRPLTSDEREHVVRTINAANPDIVWVGLSTPKQEKWMHEYRARLNAPVLAGVGAAFDFHAGNIPQAPGWMQRACLEWLFRLRTEPKRLWRRYLYNNPRFLSLVTLQLLGLKQFD